MKHLLVGLALFAAVPFAQAQTAATPYSVTTTKVSVFLDTPALLAIFKKYLPEVVANPQLEQGRDLTLPEIVQYEPVITPEKLAAIDRELKALPQQ